MQDSLDIFAGIDVKDENDLNDAEGGAGKFMGSGGHEMASVLWSEEMEQCFVRLRLGDVRHHLKAADDHSLMVTIPSANGE
ncbi:MAG: hypothetical protein HUU46_16455 [Candidatus Hydrogenedentes bacterium]|nr:hypothetical protein [Candidatus Hydrogenedentota bacterium]